MTTLIPKFKQSLTGAVNRAINFKLAEIVSIKDFGAVGDGTTDDTVAIQTALNNAGCIYIPPGVYKTTTILTVPEGVGIKGDSADTSVIRPTGCDGLSFSNSNAIGPVPIEDFWIYGDAASANTAIKVLGDATTASRVTGLRINRLRIQNFRDAINLRSTWNSSITNCIIYHNIFGIVIRGQCVKIDIHNNYIEHNLLGSVTPTATGIFVLSTFDYDPSASTERRPEDIQIHQNLVYGFVYGCQLSNGLFLTANNNDFDGTTLTGIVIGSVGGTLNVNENWIGLVGATPGNGIETIALGALANKVTNISGNEINSINPANIGIYIFTRQNNTNVLNNNISNFSQDINLQNCGNIVVKGNLCRSVGGDSIYVIGSTAATIIEIENNTTAGNLYLHPTANNAQIVLGQNDGLGSTYIRGKSVIAAGTTTVTTTYASLTSTPPDFQAAGVGYILPKLFLQTPAANIGFVYGTASTSQVVINCSSAPVADLTIYWEVKGFAYAL